ncbi:SUKH-3 domain-containing protein [Streptomyces sp. NPDC101393]|uniref:SUKH-3 domain-containing protein n=1 Tax=Streptomyces sp. NPDC101393 TaxID=3366141 RepID=UPI0037F9215F
MSRESVAEWLTVNGWTPERDISEKAGEFIHHAIQESNEEGCPVVAFEGVEDFIRSYGLLRLTHPSDPKESLIINPTGGYEGDFREIEELAQEIGKRLFRVGYDMPEGGIFVLAEDGSLYYLHHTGTYYLGADEYEAFSNWVRGNLQSV